MTHLNLQKLQKGDITQQHIDIDKIPPYPRQNKKVSVLSLVCPCPLSSPNHYDCIVLIIVLYYCVLLFYYCILFSPIFSLMATIF